MNTVTDSIEGSPGLYPATPKTLIVVTVSLRVQVREKPLRDHSRPAMRPNSISYRTNMMAGRRIGKTATWRALKFACLLPGTAVNVTPVTMRLSLPLPAWFIVSRKSRSLSLPSGFHSQNQNIYRYAIACHHLGSDCRSFHPSLLARPVLLGRE